MIDRAVLIGERSYDPALKRSRKHGELRVRQQQLTSRKLGDGERSTLDYAEERIIHQLAERTSQCIESLIRQPVEVLVIHEQVDAMIADISHLNQPVLPGLMLDREVPLLRIAAMDVIERAGQVG